MKWILSCKVGSCLRRLLAKLKGRFGGQLHYINGAQTLPPPLSRQEEEDFFKRLAGQDEEARQQLIVHNLRLVVYIAKKFGLYQNGREHTHKEVADRIGISQSYISRLEKRIIRRLRVDLREGF